MIVSKGEPLTFAPQALGEVSPIPSSTGYFYGTDGTVLASRFSTYAALYKAQPWLATVVDKLAASGARLTLVPWEQTDTGKVQDTTSPWARLWAKPSPYLHSFGFWRWTFSTYELYGEAFWIKIRNPLTGAVMGLLPMHPARTMVHRDAEGNVEYIFTLGVASAGLLRLPADDVVPFLRYHPEDLMRGQSRVEALRSTLENEQEARTSTSSFWRRGLRPSLMLSSDKVISQGSMDRLRAQVQQNHGGSGQAAGTLILEEGMKPTPVQLTAEEMQYIESRKLNREEVCGVYDVPPPVVHILDHATFSNITEQMRSMYRDTMAPRLEDVESVIRHHLLPDFDTTGRLDATFALDEVLRGDFETRATAVKSLVDTGIMKPSEARPLFDLPDAGPVADKLYANAALQELGKPAERVSLTERGLPATADQQRLMDATQAAAAAADAADSNTGNGGKVLRRRTRTLARAIEAAERRATQEVDR